jgi:biotin synthase-related radical SAM superfamily protein
MAFSDHYTPGDEQDHYAENCHMLADLIVQCALHGEQITFNSCRETELCKCILDVEIDGETMAHVSFRGSDIDIIEDAIITQIHERIREMRVEADEYVPPSEY